MKWFDIKNPEKLDTDTVFGTDTTPKTLTPGTGGVKTNPQTASELNAGSIQHSYKPMIGKAIKIPTNDNATAGSTNYMKRKYKGAERNVKFVTVRVPSSMSIAAIVLWINTCFRTVSRRPGMFIMPSGARVSINPSFTEKAKLPNRKAVSK
ncbi:MAG: hypothetical protein P2A85_09150 [Microcoleus anatoxicus]|uniref:hypothetical protein n=1 Tax=Microcoleus anatoxicus TaxID=2705319 RepID=UPI00366F8770